MILFSFKQKSVEPEVTHKVKAKAVLCFYRNVLVMLKRVGNSLLTKRIPVLQGSITAITSHREHGTLNELGHFVKRQDKNLNLI